jgi:hypothetical protein
VRVRGVRVRGVRVRGVRVRGVRVRKMRGMRGHQGWPVVVAESACCTPCTPPPLARFPWTRADHGGSAGPTSVATSRQSGRAGGGG